MIIICLASLSMCKILLFLLSTNEPINKHVRRCNYKITLVVFVNGDQIKYITLGVCTFRTATPCTGEGMLLSGITSGGHARGSTGNDAYSIYFG